MTKSLGEQAKGRKRLGMNLFRDEHSQVTNVVCIIAPVECFNGCRYFEQKNIPVIDGPI